MFISNEPSIINASETTFCAIHSLIKGMYFYDGDSSDRIYYKLRVRCSEHMNEYADETNEKHLGVWSSLEYIYRSVFIESE